jgi:hypothetical protein
MNKEAALIMIIVIMFIIILALLYTLARVIKISERQAQRMEGIDDYLFTKFLIDERKTENGRTGESS